MATLSNPIASQNIVDRFVDYVSATANSGISWGTNAVPFGEFPASYFGGTTSGKAIEVNGGTIGATGTVITAANIYNVLLAETNRYTCIRNLRALRHLSGYGYTYDHTAKAYMNTNYAQSVGTPANGGTAAGSTITSTSLETLFTNLRSAFSAAQANTVTIQINVCHSSCHSNCHGSRGRR